MIPPGLRAIDGESSQPLEGPPVQRDLVGPDQGQLRAVGIELDERLIQNPEAVVERHPVRRVRGNDPQPETRQLEHREQVL